jgi:hypothetical protein
MLTSTQVSGTATTHTQNGKYPKTPKPRATSSPLSPNAAQQGNHQSTMAHVDSRQAIFDLGASMPPAER